MPLVDYDRMRAMLTEAREEQERFAALFQPRSDIRSIIGGPCNDRYP